MKLKLSLLLFCLLGIGLFSKAQDKKKNSKPAVENGADALPVMVKSARSPHHKPPPPPPPEMNKNKLPLPPPTIKITPYTPPKIVKDPEKPAPPPPPVKPAKVKNIPVPAIPPAPDRTSI